MSLAVAWLAHAVAVDAAVFVPISDGELVDRSPLIVEAVVITVEIAPAEAFATHYRVAIRQRLKGNLTVDELVVRVPGGVREDGKALHIWGAPKFRTGDSALLFLRPGENTTYSLVELMLGAFHLETSGSTSMATRDLSEAHSLSVPGRPTPEDGPRERERFVRWVRDRAQGHRRPPDYFLPSRQPEASGLSEKYATLVSTMDPPPLGCGVHGGNRVRWFDFDTGGSAGWRTYFSGQPGLATGGIEMFQTAQAAWNDDPNSTVAMTYLGLTIATGGLQNADGTNALLFDDPNSEVPGTFANGGLLALGGPRFECTTMPYQGEDFHPITEADIVTQDGLALFFTTVPDAAKAAEQLFAHELGHTLGLAHSVDTEALMFADYHPDPRGAAIDTDDLAGILDLYGPQDLTPPTAPTNLTVDLVPSQGFQLAWVDNSDNESVFRIERRRTDEFELVTTIRADSTSYLDTNVAFGQQLYTYRVRAQNGAGASDYTLEAGIPTPDDPRPAAPSNLRAAPLSSQQIRLTWQDNADNESGFEIEVLVDDDWIMIPTRLPENADRAIVGGLLEDTEFSFRIRALNNFGTSPWSNTVRGSTFASDTACTVTGSELCLLDGRFRVSVEFRNQHDGGAEGTAVAVPSTNESGLFWFFGPENVELIVKLLDGRSFNDHFWVFYGALSDVEYWITVTDTLTDTVQIYHNPPGEICGLADTLAFSDSLAGVALTRKRSPLEPKAERLDVSKLWVEQPADTPVAAPETLESVPLESGTCAPGPESLCLLEGRLSVSVHWRNPLDDGSEGEGQAIVGNDNTGFFWFFNIENTELVVKALDGGPLNNHLWIFYGALTDVEYWVSITDTVTGTQQVYYNPPGKVCGRADLEAFVLESPTGPRDDPSTGDPN